MIALISKNRKTIASLIAATIIIIFVYAYTGRYGLLPFMEDFWVPSQKQKDAIAKGEATLASKMLGGLGGAASAQADAIKEGPSAASAQTTPAAATPATTGAAATTGAGAATTVAGAATTGAAATQQTLAAA